MSVTVHLRRVIKADTYALWIWANDEQTRSGSFSHDSIPWERHLAWLAETLSSEAKLIFIAESSSAQPLGSVRFDTSDGWRTARLSYVVAPESRRQGVSRPMISESLLMLRSKGSVEVHASVLRSNERSARVFRGLGWELREGGDSLTFVTTTDDR